MVAIVVAAVSALVAAVAAMVAVVVADLMVAVSDIVMVTTVVRCTLDSADSSDESCKCERLVHFVC